MVLQELVHEEHLRKLECISSVSLVAVGEKLRSRSFQDAVWTVVNSMVSYVPATNKLTFETVQNSLEAVAEKMQFVKCIHTRFLMVQTSVDITCEAKSSVIPECSAGSKHQTLFFINQSKTCILVAEPPAFLSVLDVIAIVISQVLGFPIPLPIGSLLFCPGGSETAVVDVLKLCSDKKEMDASVRKNSLIGNEILPQDALQVQFHPLRPFYLGEIVAWRSQNGEKLKYGRVPEDVRPSAGQALYRLKVETSPGMMQPILSSHVLSFRSILMDEKTSESLLDDNHTLYHSMGNAYMPENSRNGMAISSQVLAPSYVITY